MQTVRLVQAVALLLIVAMAASCAASKEYSSKLFAPRIPVVKDSQAVTLKFLDLDNDKTEEQGWVSTDIIMGRDTSNKTLGLALDNFSKTFPATIPAKPAPDSVPASTDMKDTKPIMAEAKTPPVAEEPVAKSIPLGGVRPKKAREE